MRLLGKSIIVIAIGSALAACSDDTSPPPPGKEAGAADLAKPKEAGSDKGGSTDKGSGDKGATVDAGGAKEAAAAPTCSAYCDKITTTCTGANVQYPDKAACNTACTTGYKLKPGSATDTSGNTIGCRTYHAGAAATDAVLHCPHAGPSGGNACGTWCEVLCDTVIANCTGANQVYADLAACKTACQAFATTGKPNDTAGNTVQCRIYHAGAAGSDPVVHCPHTTAASATCK